MTYDSVMLFGMLLTLSLMYLAVNKWGAGGGFAAFFVGIILTAAISISSGIDTDFDRCERYSSVVNEC